MLLETEGNKHLKWNKKWVVIVLSCCEKYSIKVSLSHSSFLLQEEGTSVIYGWDEHNRGIWQEDSPEQAVQ